MAIDLITRRTANLPSTKQEVMEKTREMYGALVPALQAQVGDYDPEATGSTITEDVAALQTDVQDETDGLLPRWTGYVPENSSHWSKD